LTTAVSPNIDAESPLASGVIVAANNAALVAATIVASAESTLLGVLVGRANTVGDAAGMSVACTSAVATGGVAAPSATAVTAGAAVGTAAGAGFPQLTTTKLANTTTPTHRARSPIPSLCVLFQYDYG
jgi:hypothetical protein